MNQIRTVLFLGILSILLIFVGSAISPQSLHLFVILALLMNVGSYFFSDKLVLMMHGAKEVSQEDAPKLHRIIDDLAMQAGIPKPRVCIIPADYANAFATGRNPKHGVVAVTEGILRTLDERELRGVLAHEIGHIAHRDILIASIGAVMASVISYAANMLQWAAMFGMGRSEDGEENSGAGAIIMVILAPIAAALLQMAVSRSREFLADEYAAKLTRDPESLAMALARLHHSAERDSAPVCNPATASLYIVSPLVGVGGLMNLFSTHPPVDARIEKLRALIGRV